MDESHERFGQVGLIDIGLHPEEHLLYAPLTGATAIVPSKVAACMARCREFETLDTHASAIASDIGLRGSKRLAEVRRVLAGLAAQGVLSSREAVVALLRGATTERSAPVTLRSIGVPTRNRPELLVRCVTGFAENAQRFGRSLTVSVADGSEDPADRTRTCGALRDVQARTGTFVCYAGVDEKRRFGRALVERGAPPDVTDFALFGDPRFDIATGANRNALLLQHAGEPFLSIDDDVICRQFASPEARGGLALFAGVDPSQLWCFEHDAAMLEVAEFIDQDVLASYETILGQDPRALLAAEDAGTVDLDRVSLPLVRAIESGRARVVVVTSGVAGDPGRGDPSVLLSLRGRDRERILASEASYRAHVNRHFLEVAPQRTLARGALCNGHALAFDSRTIVPPFVPVMRSQDDLYSLVLARFFPNAFVGYVPWALLHRPDPPRHYDRDAVWTARLRLGMPRLFDICIVAGCTLGPGFSTDEERLKLIGAALVQLAAMAPRDFSEFLRLEVWRRLVYEIEMVDRLLGEYDGPPYWRSDVARRRDALVRALGSAGQSAPWEVASSSSGEDTPELVRSLVERFGTLLRAWPELFAAAAELRRSGHHLMDSV